MNFMEKANTAAPLPFERRNGPKRPSEDSINFSISNGTTSTNATTGSPRIRNSKGKEQFKLLSAKTYSPTSDKFRQRVDSASGHRRPTGLHDIDAFLAENSQYEQPPLPPPPVPRNEPKPDVPAPWPST